MKGPRTFFCGSILIFVVLAFVSCGSQKFSGTEEENMRQKRLNGLVDARRRDDYSDMFNAIQGLGDYHSHKLPPGFLQTMRIIAADSMVRHLFMVPCTNGKDCESRFASTLPWAMRALPPTLRARYTRNVLQEKRKVVAAYFLEAWQAAAVLDEKKILVALQAAHAFNKENRAGVDIDREAKEIYREFLERRKLLSQGIIPSFRENRVASEETEE